MQKQAVRFIHARRPLVSIVNGYSHNYTSTMSPTGGMTVAWKLTDEENLVVAVPAVCTKDDAFVRVTGAAIAAQNMAEKDPIVTFTKAELIEISAAQFAATLSNVGDLTQQGIVAILDVYRAKLEESIVKNLTSRFFEEVVRIHLRKVYNPKVNKYAI